MAVPAVTLEQVLAELQALRKDVARLSSKREVRLLSRREAARMLGVDRGTTLEALIREGHLRLVLGKIPVGDLERLLEQGLPEPKRRAPRTAPTDEASAIRLIRL
jgi:hypothetical protein